MDKHYQHGFSEGNSAMFNNESRLRKAKTMVAVLSAHYQGEISELNLINVGGSAGIIDSYLAENFASVMSIDIDERAISFAKEQFQGANLEFKVGDAMAIDSQDGCYDVAICSQVYEHVPNAEKMMNEIYRVLKPGGVCYFAAGNRLMWNEPHYNLPLLSVIPKFLANYYVRAAKRGDEYYETHFTYWGLKSLVSRFQLIDFTKPIIETPKKYHAEYMMKPGSKKERIAKIMIQYAYWLVPGYIWLLKKS